MAKAEKEMKTEKSKKRAKITKKKKKDKVDQPIPSTIPQEGEEKEVAIAEKEMKRQKSKKRAKITKTKKKDKGDRLIPSTILQEGEEKEEVAHVHPAEEIELDDGLAAEGKKERESSYANKKVVVSGLPYTTTEQDIRDFFDKVGLISKMRMTLFPDTGNFKGLAFLTFKTMESATRSLELDGTKMGDRYIKVERCRQDPPKKRKSEFLGEPEQVEGCLSVYIGNLAKNVTEDSIRNFFDKSKIASIRLAMNKKTNKFRGFGHIDFKNKKSMEEAKKKNQMEFHGKPIKISYAAPNKP